MKDNGSPEMFSLEIEESANIGPRLETQIISFGSFKDA